MRSNSMNILLVDDDKNLRAGMKLSLEREGFFVTLADSFGAGLKQVLSKSFDVLVFDIKLGELTGLDLFNKIKQESNETPVIFISSGASLSEVAEVMRMGAFDFLEKPFSTEKLSSSIKNAVLIQDLQSRVLSLENEKSSALEIIGDSPAFVSLMRQTTQVAKTNATVLITGENGSGKELIAQKIHNESLRKNRPLVKVNCSAIPENLIESELFGHEKGAFTGAEKAKKGYFELANGGTLFLDEIGDMSLSAQAKVLRALQDSEIQKVGSERILKVDVRLIAATNKNLKKGVGEGWFREDLFFRVNVFPLVSVPLRERASDIPLLASHFLNTYAASNALGKKTVDYRVFEKLKKHSWPGNIRELKNTMERLAIVSFGNIVEKDLAGFFEVSVGSNEGMSQLSLKDFKEQSERKFLVKALVRAQGVISEAAKSLGIERTYLHKKISQHDIQKKEYFGV